VHQTTEHAAIVSWFLQGRTKYTSAMVLDAWFRGPDGSISKYSAAFDLMYSAVVPFTEIGPVRPAMTSFAVQVVRRQVVKEAEDAIKPSSGLHTSVKDKSNPKVMNWTDIGASTTSKVAEILQKHQPVTMDLMMQIAARPPHKHKGVVTERKFRPVEVVSTHFTYIQMSLDLHSIGWLGLHTRSLHFELQSFSGGETSTDCMCITVLCILRTCGPLQLQ
jgi:hypothetical protein